MSKQTVAKKDVEDYVASVGMVDLPVEVANTKNTDDIDTAEFNRLAVRAYQAALHEQIANLREQLAEVTAERDRLRLNLASTEFPTAAAQAQPVHDRHGAR